MHVAHLSLADYRCYAALELPLDPGVTSFVGPNGQGKTNLVEAIGYVATLSSHRVASDAPLVRHGAERAVIRADVVRDDRHTLVELELNPGKANRARVNRAPVPRAREVLGLLRTVLFAPEDLALVKGDPSERRRFLDELLVARAPRFAGVRADYDRVLKQRNALLKSAGAARRARSAEGALHTLDVWDAHLATAGAELLAARLDLVAALEPLVDAAYDAVSGGRGPTALAYASSLGAEALAEAGPSREGLEAALLAATAERRPAELERGVSLVGPHRDDLVLASARETRPCRSRATPATGSPGRSRSRCVWRRTTCCARTAASRCSSSMTSSRSWTPPAASGWRRWGAPAGQVLVTAAVAQDVPRALAGVRVDVQGGQVQRVG